MAREQGTFEKIADQIADKTDTDTLGYVGGVKIGAARQLVDLVNRRNRRKNLFFVLGTNGGDAHAAYKIARCLQHAYESGTVTVGVYGECKSAGTLIAISAHSVVMCQHGELGPLDVQMKKDDQLFVRSSGLTTAQALESLKKESFSQFEHFLLEIHDRTGYEISTRLALSMAIRMTTGLLGPIYQQIDPMRIGETQRAMNVARAYGERLDISRNLKPNALKKLIEEYPSHDFAIDYDEAAQLFVRIARTNELERQIGEDLAHLLLDYKTISGQAVMAYFNTEPKRTDETVESENAAQGEPDAKHGTNSSSASREGGPPSGSTNGGSGEATAAGGKRSSQATAQTARVSAKAASSNGDSSN